MHGEGAGLDVLLLGRLGDVGRLPVLDRPAHRIAAEDVEDDVEVEIGPLGRAL